MLMTKVSLVTGASSLLPPSSWGSVHSRSSFIFGDVLVLSAWIRDMKDRVVTNPWEVQAASGAKTEFPHRVLIVDREMIAATLFAATVFDSQRFGRKTSRYGCRATFCAAPWMQLARQHIPVLASLLRQIMFTSTGSPPHLHEHTFAQDFNFPPRTCCWLLTWLDEPELHLSEPSGPCSPNFTGQNGSSLLLGLLLLSCGRAKGPMSQLYPRLQPS